MELTVNNCIQDCTKPATRKPFLHVWGEGHGRSHSPATIDFNPPNSPTEGEIVYCDEHEPPLEMITAALDAFDAVCAQGGWAKHGEYELYWERLFVE